MFETMVLVCLKTNPNFCQTLADLYGPYKTERQCIERAYNISKDLSQHMPNYVAMKYKCVDILDKRIDKENI